MSEIKCPRCDNQMIEATTNMTVKKGGHFSLKLSKPVGAIVCEQCGYVELYYGDSLWAFNKTLPEEIRRKIKERRA